MDSSSPGPDLTLWGPRAPRHIGAPRKMKNEITVGENGYFDQSNRLSEERLDLRKYKPILTNYQVQLQTNPTSSSLNEDKNWYLAQINNLWGPLICGGPEHVPCWPAPNSGPANITADTLSNFATASLGKLHRKNVLVTSTCVP